MYFLAKNTLNCYRYRYHAPKHFFYLLISKNS